jgi:hypothetical protein
LLGAFTIITALGRAREWGSWWARTRGVCGYLTCARRARVRVYVHGTGSTCAPLCQRASAAGGRGEWQCQRSVRNCRRRRVYLRNAPTPMRMVPHINHSRPRSLRAWLIGRACAVSLAHAAMCLPVHEQRALVPMERCIDWVFAVHAGSVITCTLCDTHTLAHVLRRPRVDCRGRRVFYPLALANRCGCRVRVLGLYDVAWLVRTRVMCQAERARAAGARGDIVAWLCERAPLWVVVHVCAVNADFLSGEGARSMSSREMNSQEHRHTHTHTPPPPPPQTNCRPRNTQTYTRMRADHRRAAPPPPP